MTPNQTGSNPKLVSIGTALAQLENYAQSVHEAAQEKPHRVRLAAAQSNQLRLIQARMPLRL